MNTPKRLTTRGLVKALVVLGATITGCTTLPAVPTYSGAGGGSGGLGVGSVGTAGTRGAGGSGQSGVTGANSGLAGAGQPGTSAAGTSGVAGAVGAAGVTGTAGMIGSGAGSAGTALGGQGGSMAGSGAGTAGATGGAQGQAGGGGGGGTVSRPATLALGPATGFSIDFGKVGRGQSKDATFTVTNTGDQNTSPITISLTGADFTSLPPVGADCTLGMVVAGGRSCTTRVRFSPSTNGGRLASLNVIATAGGQADVTLMGSGAASLDLLAGKVVGPGYDGTGAAARFNSPNGVVSDGSGNLFVADDSNHTIRKIVIATGVVTTLAGAKGESGSADGIGAAARFTFPTGITSDGAGNLFVADSSNCTIRKVVISTGMVTTVAGGGQPGSADGTGGAARFNYPFGVTIDGAGNLFVTDGNNYTIRKVVIGTGVVTTLAGAAGQTGKTDGTGAAARFSYPQAIASDLAGNLFVSDSFAIRKVAVASGMVSTLAGGPGRGGADGYGAVAGFDQPFGLVTNGTGTLFVADSFNHTIRKIVIATGQVTTLAGTAGIFGSDDGTGAAARFLHPAGITNDGAGNLFVADMRSGTIRKVVISSAVVTTLVGATGAGSADGAAGSARFLDPAGLTSDGAGNLYVADTVNSTIRKIVVATGQVTTLAGISGPPSSVDGTGTGARFSHPTGIASDGTGSLFVTESDSYTIRRVVIATGVVTTLAGRPGGFGSDDGIGAAARFSGPYGVASDRAGNLFVVDRFNFTIRRIVVATGEVTTLAGSAGQIGSADGAGAAARFSFPYGIAGDGEGNLFVTESSNQTIRKVKISSGVVTTLAGNATVYGFQDGSSGEAALFNTPRGIAYDGAGNLFVADAGNSAIRKIAIASTSVSTVVGAAGLVGVSLGALPAALDSPNAVVVLPTGELVLTDKDALLIVRF